MRTLYLIYKQARFENRVFWRNPASPFFTFVFPIMFLVVFNLAFHSSDIAVEGGKVNTATFYVPGITALSVVSACYTNIAMSTVFARDFGVLKRLRGTPLPTLSFFGGRIAQAIWVATILIGIILGLGILLYGVQFELDKLPALLVSLGVGGFCFTSLGLAITGFVPNEDAAPAMINASTLPLTFISNVFIPTSNSPDWLNTIASIFPIARLANALHACFGPGGGSGFRFEDLGVMMIWGIAGIAISVRYFSWEPRK